MLLAYGLYRLMPELPRDQYGPPLPYIAAILASYLLTLVLLWLLATYLVRPFGSAWDETPRQSFWKSGLVLLAFVLPLPGLAANVYRLVHWCLTGLPTTPDSNWAQGAMWGYGIISEACMLALLSFGIIQTIRGLASLGGGPIPPLPPICRDCGYSLEGITPFYEAGRPRDPADPSIPTICPECGCHVTLSLDTTIRHGTIWTQGGSLWPWECVRAAVQVLFRPTRFFSHLPLAAPRRPALWFWLAGIVTTFLLVAGVLAGDYATSAPTKNITPLLPPRTPVYAQIVAGISGPPRQPEPTPMGLWLLSCAGQALGITLLIVGLGTAVLGRSASQICRLMCRHRDRNLHPAGLLLICYLSPVVLAAGVLALAAGRWRPSWLATRSCPMRRRWCASTSATRTSWQAWCGWPASCRHCYGVTWSPGVPLAASATRTNREATRETDDRQGDEQRRPLLVRPLRPQEIDWLHGMDWSPLVKERDTFYLLALAMQGRWAYVAQIDARPAGVVLASVNDTQTLLYVNHLLVQTACRGQGVGSALMDHLEKQARAAGIRRAWLLTFDAQRFYERRGYRVSGELLPAPLQDFVARVKRADLMVKDLSLAPGPPDTTFADTRPCIWTAPGRTTTAKRPP